MASGIVLCQVLIGIRAEIEIAAMAVARAKTAKTIREALGSEAAGFYGAIGEHDTDVDAAEAKAKRLADELGEWIVKARTDYGIAEHPVVARLLGKYKALTPKLMMHLRLNPRGRIVYFYWGKHASFHDPRDTCVFSETHEYVFNTEEHVGSQSISFDWVDVYGDQTPRFGAFT